MERALFAHSQQTNMTTLNNALNTIITEVRNAFGFPQLCEVQQEAPQNFSTPQCDYKVSCADGITDYFEQLGAAV
jgi:hypothetical protein